jgi:hypothetical protein
MLLLFLSGSTTTHSAAQAEKLSIVLDFSTLSSTFTQMIVSSNMSKIIV